MFPLILAFILAVVVLLKVLHFTTAITAAPTGSGTEDTLASTAFTPTGDNEIQERSQVGAGMPLFIGLDAVSLDAAAAGASAAINNRVRVSLNTWPQSRILHMGYRQFGKATGATSGVAEVQAASQPWWFRNGRGDYTGLPTDRDADWDVRVRTTTATVDVAVGLYLSYGKANRPAGGFITSRVLTGSGDQTADAWSSLGTITDLDPRFNYRLHALEGSVEDQPLIGLRVTSPSNSTYAGALFNQPGAAESMNRFVEFPSDSILVKGVETVSVEAYVGAATRAAAIVYLEELSTGTLSEAGSMAGRGIEAVKARVVA